MFRGLNNLSTERQNGFDMIGQLFAMSIQFIFCYYIEGCCTGVKWYHEVSSVNKLAKSCKAVPGMFLSKQHLKSLPDCTGSLERRKDMVSLHSDN